MAVWHVCTNVITAMYVCMYCVQSTKRKTSLLCRPCQLIYINYFIHCWYTTSLYSHVCIIQIVCQCMCSITICTSYHTLSMAYCVYCPRACAVKYAIRHLRACSKWFIAI